MADFEDIRLLKEGSKDLQRCDFREESFENLDLREGNFAHSLLDGTKFINCNLENCDFSNARLTRARFSKCEMSGTKFHGGLHNVGFSDSDLRGSRFQGIVVKCDFSGSDVRNANFSSVEFRDGNSFERVLFDDRTNFEAARGLRALSRLELFQHYRFERGTFTRISESQPSVAGAATKDSSPSIRSAPANPGKIAQQLMRNAGEARNMAMALAVAIDDQISELSIPNDPTALERYNEFVDILKQIRDGLAEISDCLSSPDTNGDDVRKASNIIAGLSDRIAGWIKQNDRTITAYGMKTGLLGAGCAFLTLCGAPAFPAFAAAIYMLEGKSLVEALKQAPKKN